MTQPEISSSMFFNLTLDRFQHYKKMMQTKNTADSENAILSDDEDVIYLFLVTTTA